MSKKKKLYKGRNNMGILDLIIDDLNKNRGPEAMKTGAKFERLHSEPYQIVTTENGIFYNPIKNINKRSVEK